MPPEMRRKDRLADQEQTWRVLEQGEYGVLSTVSPEGQPYGVPLSYCLLDGALYFHCALAGHKLDNLAANHRVSFCVVGRTQLMPEKFATLYESVVVFGRASEALEGEKRAPPGGPGGQVQPRLPRGGRGLPRQAHSRGARVFKISLDAVSGKARNA